VGYYFVWNVHYLPVDKTSHPVYPQSLSTQRSSNSSSVVRRRLTFQQPVTISNFSRRKPDILFDHHILQCATLFDRVHVFPQARFQAFLSTRTSIRSRTDGHLKRLSVASTRKIVSYEDSANHATVTTDDK